MDIGVFIPIGSNGWLISTTSPRYKPSWQLNREVVVKAEQYGMDFALSMTKLRGFGGESEFWDHAMDSFTLMAGLAAATTRIKLFASTAVLTLPPAIVARMIATIDDISGGRVGVNIVSGWQEAEYSQMGIWPGEDHFRNRYAYCAEYVSVMKDLWETGTSDFKGDYFTMDDCKLSPRPAGKIEIVCAGQSGGGMAFAAQYGDYNFCMASGVNTPTANAGSVARLAEAADKAGRDVGAYVLFMVIADETDEAAMAKWKLYNEGADPVALSWMFDQASNDKTADAGSTAATLQIPEGAVNTNMGTLVGSYESVARMLDEAAGIDGVKGIMLCFDDYSVAIDDFGTRIQPLMKSRADRLATA
ncbi:pyrimidine utilization protein A [Novosphingobium resinovorum]|uniref:pyrimidine utilization protein A n=1 Tax=Novosphingobium resinovorum TaxID=158500 RepID=UPI002ED0C77D|nr:pyrimidine utilization protein A [Novosphingobium resinovorum]